MVWCGLFLFATGFSLQTMMRNYWQEAEADGLRLQLYDLLSRLEIQPDGLPVVTEPMADPRYRQPYSGYYWQLELGETVVSRSRSLWDAHLSAHGLKSAFGDPDLFVGKGPNKEPLLIMTRTVLLPGSDRVFTLVMAKDSSALTQTLKKTRISPVSYTHLDVYKRQARESAMSLGGELRLIEDAQADVCFRLDLNVRPS